MSCHPETTGQDAGIYPGSETSSTYASRGSLEPPASSFQNPTQNILYNHHNAPLLHITCHSGSRRILLSLQSGLHGFKIFNTSRRSGDDGARLQWAEHPPSRMKGQSDWSYDPSVNLFASLLLIQAPLSHERDGVWRMPQPFPYLVVWAEPQFGGSGQDDKLHPVN